MNTICSFGRCVWSATADLEVLEQQQQEGPEPLAWRCRHCYQDNITTVTPPPTRPTKIPRQHHHLDPSFHQTLVDLKRLDTYVVLTCYNISFFFLQ